jgi:glutathione S-transferase
MQLMLELYLHPLASYCWKVLLAFYETDTPFTPLFYANELVPIEQPRTRAYLERLLAQPSMIRVRREAEPYWQFFPGARKR